MSRSNLPSSGYLFFLLLLTLAPGGCGSLGGVAPAGNPVNQRAVPARLSTLPAEAQASVSAALGRDQWAYHAKEQGEGWRLANPKHGLRADFTGRGMEVQTGGARFGLRLAGLGRGARVEAVVPGMPQAKANRVEYRRGTLTEWYVNGPLGLEQGFTLERPPARLSGEALTLSLHLSGEMSAVPDPKGDGVALQAREGATVLRYRGLVAWDAAGRTLPTWWHVKGGDVRLRVDDTAARYPLIIDPFFEQAKLTASDGAENDVFGGAVAIDGDTVVVGAQFDDIGANADQGSAYVFVKPAGGWAEALTENAKLTASDGAELNFFGDSVAVSGDTVVVEANDFSGEEVRPGSAYVFVRPVGGWAGALTESAKLTASDTAGGEFFISSVAISGDTVVAGASFNEIDGNEHQGSTYVFVKPPGGWAGLLTENAKLTASDGTGEDSFVSSVAVSGDTVVAGAQFDDIGANADQGSAYVFVKPVGGWAGALTESAKLTASDPAEADPFGDLFGHSVAVDGDTVVVGAAGGVVFTGDLGPGAAYVFVKPIGGWAGALTESAKLTASDGALFGLVVESVAISGDTVVAGGLEALVEGAGYVFVKPAGGWRGVLMENFKLTASDGASGDGFGDSVAVDGDTVVAGSSGGNEDQGSVYVFDMTALPAPGVEAQPATTQVACKRSACKIPITCNLPENLGISCANRVDLFVRASAARLIEDRVAKAPRQIKFASAIANVPPGETRNVRLRLTRAGRKIARSGKRKLRGVLEIRNTPGDIIDRTPVRIRIR